MKSYKILAVLVFALPPLFGVAGGIEFMQGSWDDVLAKAEAENKIVFVDAYTVWCGPCKMMDRNTFTEQEVGAFFNENFVNYKFDMEKGEGPAFARKYKVRGYPSLYFIAANGEVVENALGYRSAGQLLTLGQKVLGNPQNSMGRTSRSSEPNPDDPEELFRYLKQLQKEGKNVDEGAQSYFDTQFDKDLLNSRNWEAIQLFTHDIRSREFQVLLKKKKKFAQNYGERVVNEKILNVCKNSLIQAQANGEEEMVEKVFNIARIHFEDKGKTESLLKIEQAAITENWAVYEKEALKFFENHRTTDIHVLLAVIENFTLHIDKAKSLEKVLPLARQATALENSFRTNYGHAQLLAKLNRKTDAIRVASKASKLVEPFSEEEIEINAFKKALRGSM